MWWPKVVLGYPEPSIHLGSLNLFIMGKVIDFQKKDPSLNLLTKENKNKLSKITIEVEERLINIKRDLFQIGKLMSKAKSILPHGTFQEWIEKTFGKELPYSTAQAYMKIYETFQKSPKTVQLMPVHFLMNMTRNTFPEQIKDLINEHAQHMEKEDIQGVNEAFNHYKKGEISISQFETMAKKYIKLGINIEKAITERRISENASSSSFDPYDLIKAIRSWKNKMHRMYNLFPGDEKRIQDMTTQIDRMINELEEAKQAIKSENGGFFKTVWDPKEGKKTVSNL